MTVEKKLRKGGLARVSVRPKSWMGDDLKHIDGTAILSIEERQQWYDDLHKEVAEAVARGEDPFHIAMNDAGESRLAPTAMRVKIYFDKPYQVLRARCVGQWSYHRHPGQALLLDLETGREVYVKRELLEAL